MSGYPDVLKYFMWGYQVIYRIDCETHADILFDKLDRGLQPKVFLIGFLKGTDVTKHTVCVDPESFENIIPELQDIEEKARKIASSKDDRRTFYTGEGVQEKMDKKLTLESKRLALQDTLKGLSEFENSEVFVSQRIESKKYDFYVVLELNKFVYDSHVHLKRGDPENRFRLRLSLLECVVETYLEEASKAFKEPREDEFHQFECRSSSEILRKAADNFIYTIAHVGKDFQGIHGLIETCNKLSQSRYESEELTGTMIIAAIGHPNVEMVIELQSPFSIRDYRKTRKLLQQSSGNYAVVTNSARVLGLGKVKESYDPKEESVYKIEFESLHKWKVTHHNKTLMQMNYGLPQFSEEIISKDNFRSTISRIFPGITENEMFFIYLHSVYLTKFKKGAMLIISDQAEEEAQRLSNQCMLLKPILLTFDLLTMMTKIDGGILIDRHGLCFANGILLDGIVGKRGDSARGSRYNSALTYHENNEYSKSTLIIVVSEDGMVDMIPSLRPKIKHADVTAIIGVLKEINDIELPDKARFDEAMQWLKDRRFYLNQEECDQVNLLNDAISQMHKDASMRIIYDQLSPDPDMNDTYYEDNI